MTPYTFGQLMNTDEIRHVTTKPVTALFNGNPNSKVYFKKRYMNSATIQGVSRQEVSNNIVTYGSPTNAVTPAVAD